MATFVKSQSAPPASSSGGGVRFVKPGEYQAPPMNIESPFWSMPPYGDGTAASLAATRPGQPDEKVGYGELSNIAGRTGAEMTAAIVGTIPEFAAELATGVANNPNQPGSLPQQSFRSDMERENAAFQRMGQNQIAMPIQDAPVPRGTLQNPIAGAGAFARQQFSLNDPQNQPNPALYPENTPYMDFSGDTPMRNKVLRLASEGAGMVPIGTEIAAGTAIGGPIVGGAAAALAMGAEKFQRGLDEGKSRNEALQEGTISALGNTALFSVPLAAHAAKYLPPRLASRMVTVALSSLEMGGKMMGTGGVDAASNIDVVPTSTEEWKKAYEDVRDGTWNARSNFLAGALLGGFQGAMTPLGRAKAQAEAKSALDEFVDLGDATVRPRTEPSEQIGRSGNGVDVQRNAFGRDGGVRFQQGQRALPGPALPAPEPQGAITGPNGRPAIANPRATAPLADAPLFDPNRQVMPEAEVAALIDSLNQQLQSSGRRIAVEPIGGAQGPLGLPPGAARGPMPEPPPAIPLPPPMGVGRPIEEAPSRRAVPETAAAPEAPAIPQPTPEQLALEQQILNADLVDSRDIPKPAPETPKTAKQKLAALRDARKQSLIDTTVAVESAEEVRARAQKLLEIGKEINATGTPEEKRAIQSEVRDVTWRLKQLNEQEAPTKQPWEMTREEYDLWRIDELNRRNPQLGGALKGEIVDSMPHDRYRSSEETTGMETLEGAHSHSTVTRRKNARSGTWTHEIRHMIDMLLGGNQVRAFIGDIRKNGDAFSRLTSKLKEMKKQGAIDPNGRLTDDAEVAQVALDAFYSDRAGLREVAPDLVDFLEKMSADKYADLNLPHRKAIEQAIASGKSVPPEVLASYPDITPTQPTSPSQSAVEPQTPVGATQTAPEFSDMVKEAQRWRGAAMNVARGLEGSPRDALKHSSQTTKGDLDKYLMKKFGVGPTEARDVSNELTRLNLPDDLTAQPEDFAGEPWVKPAQPAATFKGMQPRPRGQAPIPLYNIPDGKGGQTTVSAETAAAQGYSVPEPPVEAKVQKQPWEMTEQDLADTGVTDTGVKDDTGKPIVFYHGTLNMKPGEPFTGMRLDISPSGSQRNTGRGGADTLGMWFTDKPEEAPYYTQKFDTDTREEAVLPAYIKAQNPLVFNSIDEYKAWIENYASFYGGVKPGAGFGTADMNSVRERLALGGKDAIIIKNAAEIGSGTATWAVALKPEAIVASAPVRPSDLPKPTPTAKEKLAAKVEERKAAQEPVYSPETQAIVDAYGGRTKALEVLMRQRAAQRGNEKASPQTLAAIEELTGGKKTGQADLFGLGDMRPAPKADLPGQTRLTTETRVIGKNVPTQYAEIPGNDALTDIRKQIIKLGVKPGGRFTAEDLGYTGKNKPPWVRESGRYTTDQWLEQAHEAGLISADELSDPSAIQRLMRGKQNTKIPVAPAGVEIPGVNQKAPDTGKPSSIGDIMQGMGLTEQKPAPKSIGFRSMLDRKQIAGDKFVESVMEQFGKTKEQAEQVLAYYSKNKLVKLDPVDGQFKLKHGAFWEQSAIDSVFDQPAPPAAKKPAKPPASPVETTSGTESTKAQASDFEQRMAAQESMTPAERMADVMARFKDGEINQQQATAMRKAILKEKADAEKQAKKDAPKKGKKRGPNMDDPEAGAINLSAMGDLVVAAAKGRPIIRNTKGLPEKVFDESIRARGLVNKYERRAQQVVADFEQGYRKSVGGVKGMMSKVPDNLLQLGTDYLTERSPAGKQAILSQFPVEMHAPLRQMRTLVDELTQKWINWGVVSPGRTQILKNNKGSYLSRQYKTFNEPNFRNIIPEMVKQRMRNLLRKWDPSVPNTKAGDDIIEGRLNEWIDVSEDENSGLMWRGSPLGARNFDIMKQRNDFPQEVLDLWGVEKDVTKNLLNTVMKQAKPLANTIFQNKVLDHGRENNYIFTKADIEDIQSGKAPTAKAKAYGELQKNRQGTWMTEAAEQGKSASPYASMGVLADVYVPKPLKNAMQDMMKTQEHGLLMKTLLQYNGIAAMSKTVGSVTTQSLNFIANQGFFFGSGYAFYKPLTLANRINQAIAMTGTELKSTWGRSARELAGRGLELGVMNDADVSQEIAKLIEGGKGGVFSVPATKLAEWGDRYRANRTEKSRRAIGAAAQVPKWIQDVAGTLRDEAVSMYQAGDDFWKALMWLSDTEYQMDLNPSWSRAKAEEAAAVAIREYGLPFYSESPRFIQNLRYVPIPAPFKTYAVEAPRVLINQATQAKSEIFSGNATATAMGFRRSLGQAFAYGMPIAGSIASALAWKLSDQDEDTIRDMGPEWNRDSNFVHYNVDRSKGIVKYWNVSRTSVQSEIGDPINAFIRGDEATDKAARLALASLDPFLQEQLGWKALRQVIENEDDYGRPIYNDADTDIEFAKKVGSVLGKSILPGTVESVRRILKDDAPIQKSLAEATGQRITTVNMPKELEYATRSYMASVRAPSMDVKKAESGGNVSDIAEQKRQRLDYHKQQWESLHDKVSGMKAFGVDTIRIMDALKKGGMSQKNINNLMYGIYVPPESMQ